MRIRPWVERVVSTWQETHSSRLEVRSQLDDITVQADPTAIQVILKNLLENSIRHSRKSKVVVTLATESQSGRVALRFQDDGEGFEGTAESLGQIFQKGRNSQGAGVGLYLVRVLMERMGGRAQFGGSPGFQAQLWFKEGQLDA
jgi:signal transduction histidine kinase